MSSAWDNPASLRILCLHDGNSHALLLKQYLKALGDRLYENHQIDLVYVNAPITVSHDDPPLRAWYKDATDTSFIDSARRLVINDTTDKIRDQSDGKDKEAVNTSTTTQDRVISSNNDTDTDAEAALAVSDECSSSCLGLDASIQLLQQVWQSTNFQGIIGVGQGAHMASIMALLPTLSPCGPHFVALVHPPDNAFDLVGSTHLACLQVIFDSTEKENIHSDRLQTSQQLGKVVRVDNKRSMYNVIGRFLVEQKQRLTSKALSIPQIQAELALAEQQVHRLLIERIASNPPSSLMAILGPTTVGGWQGRSKVLQRVGEESNDQGYGAPCPSDFLLRPSERTRATDAKQQAVECSGRVDDAR
jgi:Serine hydrolase (FSH1)